MVWMQTYLFYCSVRLGVIIIALLTSIQLLTPAVLLIVQGISLLDKLVNIFQNDEFYRKNIFINKLLIWIDEHPENVIIISNLVSFLYIGTCFLTIYGAVKLSKYYLLPFIFLEFWRVLLCLAFHIILMIMLKKIINLGVLVAFTLIGGFLILYLAYNWCACVALYQIFELIRSNRYRELYGDNPYEPRLRKSYKNKNSFSYKTIENVHVIKTPNSGEIDELKRRNNSQSKIYYQNQINREIVSVIPSNSTLNDTPNINKNNDLEKKIHRKWWHKEENTNELLERDPSVNYGNWQWSELLIKGSHKSNPLIITNKY